MTLTIGVDIGGTKIAAGVVDANGKILTRTRVVRVADGATPTWVQSVLRWSIPVLVLLLLAVFPANVRRTTTPTALTTAMPTIRRHAASTVDVATLPSSKRGMTTWSIIQRTPSEEPAVQKANTAAPVTAIAKEPG